MVNFMYILPHPLKIQTLTTACKGLVSSALFTSVNSDSHQCCFCLLAHISAVILLLFLLSSLWVPGKCLNSSPLFSEFPLRAAEKFLPQPPHRAEQGFGQGRPCWEHGGLTVLERPVFGSLREACQIKGGPQVLALAMQEEACAWERTVQGRTEPGLWPGSRPLSDTWPPISNACTLVLKPCCWAPGQEDRKPTDIEFQHRHSLVCVMRAN